MSSEAIRLKEDGSKAWQAGNYLEAANHFSSAINNCPASEVETIRILYSNRSACYLKIGRAAEALVDATRSLESESTWPKGLLRKADALFVLRRYPEAINVYTAILNVTPNDSNIKDKIEQVRRAMSSGSAPSNVPSTMSGPPLNFDGKKIVMIASYLRMAVVVLGFCYFIPIRSISSTAHRFFLFAAIGAYGINLFEMHGFPKFNSAYFQTLTMDPVSTLFFLAVLQLSVNPYFLAMLPLILNELGHCLPMIIQYLSLKNPEALSKANTLISTYAPKVLGGEFQWDRIPAPAKWNLGYTMIQQLSATAEVMQGVFLIMELFLPTRNFIFLYLWWQYLKMRVMIDRNGHIKDAFKQLDAQILSLLSYSFVPQVIRNGYFSLKGFLERQVQVTGESGASGSGLGGLMSKCCIM